MMPPMRSPLPLCLLLAFSGLAVACNPCHESCRDLADTYDECLLDWELQWEDVGAKDRDEFRDLCFDDRDQRAASGDEDAVFEECRALQRTLRSASSCEDVLTALNGSP